MKKLYFWSRLNFSKYFIPQKLGKFRQHWSSQKSRSEVDDVKDRVIKWSLFDIVYFINFESPFCTISLKNITFIFTAYFQKVFEFWKKIIHLFWSNHKIFCHRVHYEPHLKLHFLTPLLFSLAVLKSTLLPKRPLKRVSRDVFEALCPKRASKWGLKNQKCEP